MTCHYCADGIVYDLAWATERGWQQVRVGKCKRCAGGECEPSRMVREIAERTGWTCPRVIFNLMMGCLEFKLENHRFATEGELTDIFRRRFPKLNLGGLPEPHILPADQPREVIADAKPETGTQLPIKPGSTLDDDFEEEQPGIPF